VNKNDALINLSERLYPSLRGTPFHQQSEPHRVFTAVYELEAEVHNGGFEQFFSNSTGEMWDAIEPALLTIGAPKMAKLARPWSRFPAAAAGRPVRAAQGVRGSDAVRAEWGTLDHEFLRYPRI
jgi:hypothetical protein